MSYVKYSTLNFHLAKAFVSVRLDFWLMVVQDLDATAWTRLDSGDCHQLSILCTNAGLSHPEGITLCKMP